MDLTAADTLTAAEAMIAGVYGIGGGAGFAVALQFVKWLMTFGASRIDKQEEHVDKKTQLLFDRMESQIVSLTERVDRAEADLRHCNEQHAEAQRQAADARAEVTELRKLLQSVGDPKIRAALTVSRDSTKGPKA